MAEIRNYELESHDNDLRDYRYSADHIVRDLYLKRIEASEFKLERGMKVLEIGSHDGSMTSQILDYVDTLNVMEPVVALHGLLKEKFGTRIVLHSGSIEDSNFEEKFDAIFLVHVLEHVENPTNALSQISKWLKSSGMLHVMVPNANALSRQLACKMGIMHSTTEVLEGERLQGHLRSYLADEFTGDIRNAGLQIKTFGGILHKPLANFQLDQCLNLGIIDMRYISALDEYAKNDPSEASSIFVVATR